MRQKNASEKCVRNILHPSSPTIFFLPNHDVLQKQNVEIPNQITNVMNSTTPKSMVWVVVSFDVVFDGCGSGTEELCRVVVVVVVGTATAFNKKGVSIFVGATVASNFGDKRGS